MKMLILVFRSTLNEEVLSVLDGLKLPGYTETAEVYGTGSTGRVFDSHAWPGYNSMVLSAVGEGDARKVAGALGELSVRLTAQGEKVPLRLFAVPCEQLL